MLSSILCYLLCTIPTFEISQPNQLRSRTFNNVRQNENNFELRKNGLIEIFHFDFVSLPERDLLLLENSVLTEPIYQE